MEKLGLTESPFPKLSSDEILELERIYEDMGGKVLNRKLCLETAKRFSSSSNGAGKQAADLNDLGFEARSTKDIAWHDVSMFLNYRVLSTGDLEVCVQYAGFGKEQDEWMNVKLEVRERSIPLEPSECHTVKDGDLILCFLEREDYALYCDARIVKIQRKIHDPTECTCTFIVRFVHDNTEEGVSFDRICCRPTQEESACYPDLALGPTSSPSLNVTLNTIESLWG